MAEVANILEEIASDSWRLPAITFKSLPQALQAHF